MQKNYQDSALLLYDQSLDTPLSDNCNSQIIAQHHESV